MATSHKRVHGVKVPLRRWVAVFNIRCAAIILLRRARSGWHGSRIVQGPMKNFCTRPTPVKCVAAAPLERLRASYAWRFCAGVRIVEFYCSCAAKIVLRRIRPG